MIPRRSRNVSIARPNSARARPPRAWCLAIRASDTRLAADAPYLTANARVRPAPDHTLTIDAATIRTLCAPVELTAPGHTLDVVAAKLGTTRGCLLNARVAGVFRTHYVTGLDAHFGKPRPLLYTDQPLDPASRGFGAPDAVWSWSATHLIPRLPRDLPPQHLRRTAHYHGRGPDYNIDLDAIHPEHPARDGSTSSPQAGRRSLKLPPPPPDYVGYKWQDGVYVGHDWKKPAARAGYYRREQRLALARTAARQRRLENPPPSKSRGSLEFRGWRWRCPKCERKVNVLFMPMPPINLLRDVALVNPKTEARSPKEARSSNAEKDSGRRPTSDFAHSGFFRTSDFELRTSARTFACEKCTRLRRFSRCDPNAWNEIITYLSAGLLFGREVDQPKWWPKAQRADRAARHHVTPSPTHLVTTPEEEDASTGRKIAYKPRLTRAPSRRRPQIEQMILAGLTFKQIAKKLGLAYGTVLWTAQQICKQHGVRSLPELLHKHGQTPKLTKRAEVKQRFEQEQSPAEIAAAMGVKVASVYEHVYRLRKSGKLVATVRAPAIELPSS